MDERIWARNQTDALAIVDAVLYTRLSQTIEWTNACVARPGFHPSMRSKDLQWRLLHLGRDDAVCEVGTARQFQLTGATTPIQTTFPKLRNGRLMVYFPDGDLCDGAAEQETEGFFDVYNVPPWDTWVGYFDDAPNSGGSCDAYLLAYVPEKLVETVNSGIIVNPEECILWLSDSDTKIRTRLTR